MTNGELTRLIAEEISEGRELKRDDRAIASRILDALANAEALRDDDWDYE